MESNSGAFPKPNHFSVKLMIHLVFNMSLRIQILKKINTEKILIPQNIGFAGLIFFNIGGIEKINMILKKNNNIDFLF